MLRIYGFINREHLVRKFRVSIPQASKDLNKFLKEYPDRMVYNQHLKRYEHKPFDKEEIRRGAQLAKDYHGG